MLNEYNPIQLTTKWILCDSNNIYCSVNGQFKLNIIHFQNRIKSGQLSHKQRTLLGSTAPSSGKAQYYRSCADLSPLPPPGGGRQSRQKILHNKEREERLRQVPTFVGIHQLMQNSIQMNHESGNLSWSHWRTSTGRLQIRTIDRTNASTQWEWSEIWLVIMAKGSKLSYITACICFKPSMCLWTWVLISWGL